MITHETNGIRFTDLDRHQLNRNRYTAPDQAAAEELTAAYSHAVGNLSRREFTAPKRRDLRFRSSRSFRQ